MHTKSARVLHLLLSLALLFTFSCKEKNEDYPLPPWSEYHYDFSSNQPIRSILPVNDHEMWLGFEGNTGLFYFDGYKWQILKEVPSGENLADISQIIQNGSKTTWFAGSFGIAKLENGAWTTENFLKDKPVKALVTEGIANLYAAISGNDGGIARLTNGNWSMLTSENSDLPTNQINCMKLLPDGTLVMCTQEKRIITLSAEGEFHSPFSDMNTILSNEFISIALDEKGNIRAGNTAGQIVCLNADGSKQVLNTGLDVEITAMVFDKKGQLWCSTNGNGIIRISNGEFSEYTKESAKLPDDNILSMAEGSNGEIFFSNYNGHLYYFKPW
jgi:ligand-binding sensor domain-containing protein